MSWLEVLEEIVLASEYFVIPTPLDRIVYASSENDNQMTPALDYQTIIPTPPVFGSLEIS